VVETADQILTKTYEKIGLDLAKLILGVVTFFYGTGYLIQAITLRNYGIQRFEALKLQYIEVGVTFTVLTLLLTVLPVGCYMAHFRIRKKSKLPHYKIGAVGYLANTCNLFLLVVCFSLFITQQEWSAVIVNIKRWGIQLRVSELCSLYVTVSVFVLIFLPLIERVVVARCKRVRLVYWLFVEPIRYSAVILGILFDLGILAEFSWIKLLILRGLMFWASAVCLIGTIYVVVYYMRKLGDRRTLHVLAVLGTTGAFVLLYMCINAYVYAVVRHIPMNRGGKLPVTQSYLVTNDTTMKSLPLKSRQESGCSIWGPVYIIEESQDYLHVAKVDDGEWLKTWIQTFSIRKDTVDYIQNERITVGGPRGSSP